MIGSMQLEEWMIGTIFSHASCHRVIRPMIIGFGLQIFFHAAVVAMLVQTASHWK